MKKKLITFLNIISEYGQILIGVILASIGLKAFLLPNGFLDGGVTGIAILVSKQTDFNISILLFLISIPFLILAFFTVSKRIIFKSLLAILCLAISIQLETFETITDDKLLIAIFGGLFLGGGIGITIRNGAVLDGSEILGIFLNDRFGISIGRTVLVFNVILFAVTAAVLSVEVAMYSILTYLVTAKVIDTIIEGFEDFIGLTIVSKDPESMRQAIIERVGTGLTIYKGESGYGGRGQRRDIRIIHTVINRIDIKKMHRVINDVDHTAFVIEFEVSNIRGGVLRRYFDRKHNKKTVPVPQNL